MGTSDMGSPFKVKASFTLNRSATNYSATSAFAHTDNLSGCFLTFRSQSTLIPSAHLLRGRYRNMSAATDAVIETCKVEDQCYLSKLPPPPRYVTLLSHSYDMMRSADCSKFCVQRLVQVIVGKDNRKTFHVHRDRRAAVAG